MKTLRALLFRAWGLLPRHRARLESEFQQEIESHLDLHIAAHLRAGHSPEEARRLALVDAGSLSAAREAYRDRASLPFAEHAMRDLTFALRQFAHSPVFTLTAVSVLALGLAATTAILAFAHAAFVRPFPYPDPASLVAVDESSANFPRNNLSYPDYLDWKKEARSLASFDVYKGTGYLLRTASGTTPLTAAQVSAGFFQTLGVKPALGRAFMTGEDLPAAHRTVILSHTAWRKYFQADPHILGRSISLSGEAHTVIGILGDGFRFAPRGDAELWTPLNPVRGCDVRRSCHSLDGVARLKQGVTRTGALSELQLIARRLERQYPDSNRGQGASVIPFSELVVGQLGAVLLLLLAGSALLLFIAIVNVSSLLLVRSESRRHEFALRAGLGASRARLAAQSLTESLLLVTLSLVLAVILAQAAITLLLKLIPAAMLKFVPFLEAVGLHLPVLGALLLLALLAAAIFSLTPLLFQGQSGSRSTLAGGTRWSANLTWSRLGSKLVVVQLATAVVLIVTAGLLGKSFYLLLRLDLGFSASHLAIVSVAAPELAYPKPAQQARLAQDVFRQVSALPGVSSAALTTFPPVTCNCNTDWLRIVGKPFDGTHEDVLEREVSPAFFATLQARLVRGRLFTEADDASRPNLAIVNRAFVDKYLPHEDPIGRRISDLQLTPSSFREIVGVVDNIHEGNLEEPIWPAEYLPFSQGPDTYFYLLVRTRDDERNILPTLDGLLRRTHPELGLSDMTSFSQRTNDSVTAYLHRSSTWLVGGYAAVALLLSLVGLYGVVAYSVSRRTRELGVRMALGASHSSVYRLILGEAAGLVIAGLFFGVVASLAAARAFQKLLFNVGAFDAPTLGAVILLLALAAALASFAPARRATRVNPVDALRVE